MAQNDLKDTQKQSYASIRNLGVYGVMRRAEVDDYLIPDGAVEEAINVHFDRKGAITSRPGIASVGSTIAAGYPIWGLHNTQNGTMIACISQSSSMRVYAFGGAAWATNLTSGTANVRIRFLDFANRTICLNWGNASGMYSSLQVWAQKENNAAWITSGNPINPQGLTDQISPSPQPQYGEVFKSRVYVAGGDTDGSELRKSRLWFSSVISSAGNITWNPSIDFVDINPNDGENISGLKRYSLELLVFKPNYLYRFRTSGLDPDPLIKIGTRSNESLIEGKKGLYFHHDTGFYRYTGGYPVEISRPISDIVDAISYANYSKIQSWRDNDHIYWGIGDITISGVTWKNVTIRYTESSEIWTVYSYPNTIKCASDYNSSLALTRVIGLDNGVVATVNSGTTDLGEPIKFRVITKWYEHTIKYKKVLKRLASICEKAQATTLKYQIDATEEWKAIGKGQITRFLTDFDDLNISYHRIRFKVDGVIKVESMIWLGLELIEVQNQGVIID